MQKNNAYSLSFLRPLFKSLKQGNLVLIRVIYSRQGGNSQVFVVENEFQLKFHLRKLPEKAAVQWWDLEEPEWNMNPTGYIPTDGQVITGAY